MTSFTPSSFTLEALNLIYKSSENEVYLLGDERYSEYIQVAKTLTVMGINKNAVIAEYCPLR